VSWGGSAHTNDDNDDDDCYSIFFITLLLLIFTGHTVHYMRKDALSPKMLSDQRWEVCTTSNRRGTKK
jgi:hypothetical protein